MYGGVYRRPSADVAMVDNFKGVLSGSIAVVNQDGNYVPPHLAEVKQVDGTSFTARWLQGKMGALAWISTQISK